MANLVDQIFQAVDSATSKSPPYMAQGFERGIKLGSDLAQLPLKQTLMQQESKLNEFKLTDLMTQRQATLDNEDAYQQTSNLVGQALTSQNPEDAESYVWDAISRNKGLWRHPGIKPLLEDARASLAGKLQMQVLKASSQFTSPEVKTITDPDTGEQIQVVREGPNSWRPVQTPNEVSVTTPSGEVITSKTGGTAKGGGGNVLLNNLQPGVVSEIEKKIAASEQSGQFLQEAISKINPSTIGPVGWAKEKVETVGNIVNPGSVGTEATKARQTFRITAQNLYNSLKADSQINKMEAVAMSSIGDITKLDESSDTAREKYQTLSDLTALKTVLQYHQLNRIASDKTLNMMSKEIVAKYFANGTLTPEEVRRWGKLKGISQ